MNIRHFIFAAAAVLSVGSVSAQSAAPAPLCDGWYCILGSGKPTDTPATGTSTSVEPGTGTGSAASTPLDTESTALDYLKNDPNYEDLFVKEPATGAGGTNPCAVFSCIGTGSGAPAGPAAGTPVADTETTVLDYLKNDPNYKDLFVKEPATGTNPCDVFSCIGSGSGAPAGPAPGTPVGVTDETALDYLKNNPAYASMLKDPAFTGGEAAPGSTSGQPSSGPGLGLSDPNCVSYYTYVCDKDLPGAKDNAGKDEDDDKKTPEEQATAAANSMADYLTGDVKYACEALMCLSTSDRPGECDPAIAKYLSIKKKKASQTAQARADFLAMCPISGDNGPKLKP